MQQRAAVAAVLLPGTARCVLLGVFVVVWRVVAFLLVAVGTVAIGVRIWQAGLRRYSGASS